MGGNAGMPMAPGAPPPARGLLPEAEDGRRIGKSGTPGHHPASSINAVAPPGLGGSLSKDTLGVNSSPNLPPHNLGGQPTSINSDSAGVSNGRLTPQQQMFPPFAPNGMYGPSGNSAQQQVGNRLLQ